MFPMAGSCLRRAAAGAPNTCPRRRTQTHRTPQTITLMLVKKYMLPEAMYVQLAGWVQLQAQHALWHPTLGIWSGIVRITPLHPAGGGRPHVQRARHTPTHSSHLITTILHFIPSARSWLGRVKATASISLAYQQETKDGWTHNLSGTIAVGYTKAVRYPHCPGLCTVLCMYEGCAIHTLPTVMYVFMY